MNGLDMMRAMNALDQEYLNEAERPRLARQISIRTIRVVASLVLAFAIVLPIGAYAAGFLHPENVDFYLEGVEANDTIVKNVEMENQDLKMTLEAQLSDGHNVMQIFTYEAKTEHGEELLEPHILWAQTLIQYEDGSESPYYDTGAAQELPRFAGTVSSMLSIEEEQGVHRFVRWIPCSGIDLTKPLRVDYYVNMEDPYGFAVSEQNKAGKYIFHIAEKFENELEGFSYLTDFAPNVPVAAFLSETGEEIHMSAFELWSDSVWMDVMETVLVREDGERISLKKENNVGNNKGYEINPGRYLHPEEYSGVEVNGKLFQKIE